MYSKIKEYSESGVYPFHMPGHKRSFGSSDIPYNLDITEIHGFDNLHSAHGCIKDIAIKAAKLYSVKYARLLVNGATGGILSAIRAMTSIGDKILIARNCHKSVYNAAELCCLTAEYVFPRINPHFGLSASVSPSDVETALQSDKSIRLVVITSPTYEGVVSDIKSISEICRRYNVLLLVDEAHGAHFPFCGCFPSEAVSLGADAAVVSLHKTLPSLTQTALLLTNNDSLDGAFGENLSVFETSSPSYVLLCAIEKCLEYLKNSESDFELYSRRLSDFYSAAKDLEHFRILDKQRDFYDFDKGKIVISTAGTNVTGTRLAGALRDKYRIETEMAYTDYVIAMTSVCDSNEGFSRLLQALKNEDISAQSIGQTQFRHRFVTPEKRLFNPFDRQKYRAQLLPLKQSCGKPSFDYLWAYPPGIPILVPGEIISPEIISHILALEQSGVEVNSSSASAAGYVKVALT